MGGTDFARRDDLLKCWERWRISWSPALDASAIEAARYGPTLLEATAARLLEAAAAIERDAAAPPGSCSMPSSPGSTRSPASYKSSLPLYPPRMANSWP